MVIIANPLTAQESIKIVDPRIDSLIENDDGFQLLDHKKGRTKILSDTGIWNCVVKDGSICMN